jgi:hypothetical protein
MGDLMDMEDDPARDNERRRATADQELVSRLSNELDSAMTQHAERTLHNFQESGRDIRQM